MVTYFLLSAALALVGARFLRLLWLKKRTLPDAEIDRHLHRLLNEKRERP